MTTTGTVRRRGRRIGIGTVSSQAVMVLWTLIVLVPFIAIFSLGFRDNAGMFSNAFGFGGTLHPENFIEAWTGPVGGYGLGSTLGNSVVAFLAAVIVNLVLGTGGAYFVTRLPRRVQGAYLTAFVLGTVLPFVLILIPIYRMFSAFGLLSNPFALGVLYGILGLPGTVLILNGFFAGFPLELIEAAKVDGLGEGRTFLSIVLPLSLGAVTTCGLLLAISVWSETQLAIVVLQDSASQTAAVGILGFRGQFVSSLGPLFAGLTLLTVPVMVLYLVFNRTISKGIALGGVLK